MSDPYRTKAKIPPKPSPQEKILRDIIRDEVRMKEIKTFKLWKDIKLGFGLLALLAVCFLVSFLSIFRMLNPLFSYGATMFLGLCAVGTAGAAAIIFSAVIESIRTFFRRVEGGKRTARIIKNLKKEIEEQKAQLENG